MMFIVRTSDSAPDLAAVEVKAVRKTPATVANGGRTSDYFCVGEAAAIEVLRARGFEIVELRDGWYADDAGGGVAISGHGRYWEVRDTPFTVKETVAPADLPTGTTADGEQVNVRRAIFGV